MNWKTKVRWGALAALLGYSACVGTVGYKVGYAQGQNDKAQEKVCAQKLQKLREEFVHTCEQSNYETYQHGRDLASIVRKREQLEEVFGCETDEEWKCEPTIPSNLPKSEFRARFYSK